MVQSQSLKDQNRWPLFGLVAANMVVFWGLVSTQAFEPTRWFAQLAELHSALPAALAMALTGLLNHQLSPDTKDRLVFWDWEHPLPGCEAFSHYLDRDPRILRAPLERRFGPFPNEPLEQNRLWYQIYSTVSTAPSVSTANRNYLFSRDFAALAAMMLIGFGAVALGMLKTPIFFIAYTAALAVQYLLAMNAARKHGVRLVTNAMALASTHKE